jgi:hypothetical protein
MDIDLGWGIEKFDRDVELRLLNVHAARCSAKGT